MRSNFGIDGRPADLTVERPQLLANCAQIDVAVEGA